MYVVSDDTVKNSVDNSKIINIKCIYNKRERE